MSVVNRTIDDRDTTDLKYAGNWFLTGTWNASHVGESGTLASSEDLNCNVTFTFPVPAVAFYYFGIPRCCGGFYQICVDCDPNNPQWKDIDAVNVTDDGKNPPIVLYSQNFDGPPGVHEVILQNRNDTRFGHSQITLDSFVIEVPGASTTSSSSSASPTSASVVSSTGTSSPLHSPSPSSVPVGAIVGGVVGALLVIIGAIFIFILLKRRRRKAGIPSLPQRGPPNPGLYTTPEMSQNNTNTLVDSYRRSTAKRIHRNGAKPYNVSTMSTSTAPSSSTGPASTTASASYVNHSRDLSSAILESEAIPTEIQRARRERREVDAGPVSMNSDEEEGDTLPPDYRDVFTVARSPTTSSRQR